MSIPLGYTPMSPLMLAEAAEQQAQEQGGRERERQAHQQATARVCRSLGVTERQLTPAQRALAENIANQLLGRTASQPRGYGFNIPTEGRRPQRW